MTRNYRHTDISRKIHLEVSAGTHIDEIEAALVAVLDAFDGDGKTVAVFIRLEERYLKEKEHNL